jgi:protein TonB
VIDTKGNVVEEHTVSGNEFLVAAATDALRQWKYEPTVLDGQVFPVYLRVTIGFRLGRKS